jgi:hypothetical protein
VVCTVSNDTSSPRKLSHAANAGRHSLADRGQDCYETPPEATRALMAVEKLPHWLWEPACGPGAIVRVLRDAGHAVIASDIADYGFPMHFRRDFLDTTTAPIGMEAVVTNPPYKLAGEFAAHALDLVPHFWSRSGAHRSSTAAGWHASMYFATDCQ